MALAVSMLDPPPTAPNASHGRVARGVHALVRRLHPHPVEYPGLDPERGHLVRDPLRDAGRGDSRIGHHQGPAHPVLAQVEPDLVGGTRAELELRRAVREDRLRVRRGRAWCGDAHGMTP